MYDVAITLGLPYGDAYRRLYAFLPLWALWTVGIALTASVAWSFLKSREFNIPIALDQRRAVDWRIFIGLILWCVTLLIFLDGNSFLNGFFRADDFSFLQVARENNRLLPQLLLYHNDHAYPLFRLEIWALVKLAGPLIDAIHLAEYFNAIIFLSCCLLLCMGCWLLYETVSSSIALFIFPFALWLWPGWGEFTAGFFALSGYIQVQSASFGAAAAMLRGFRRGKRMWLVISILMATIAVSIDTTGLSVFITLGIVTVASVQRRGNSILIQYLLSLFLLFGTVILFFKFAFAHPYSARELVQNPSGNSFNLFEIHFDKTQLIPMTLGLLAGVGGVAASFFTPTFLQYLNFRLTMKITLGLYGIQFLVSILVVLLLWRALRRLNCRDAWLSLAFIGNAFALVAMVIVARPLVAVSEPTVLWAPKYLVMPICWFSLAATFVGDRYCSAISVSRLHAAKGLIFAGAFGLWFSLSNWYLEKAVFPTPSAYISRGRFGNVENARARYERYTSLMQDLSQIARFTGSNEIALPPPQAWGGAFYSANGVLEWGSDYTSNGVTNLFWDFLAASPDHSLRGKWQSLDTMPSSTREYLKKYKWLAPAFVNSDPPNSAHSNDAKK
jgi:hypothetical protein